MVRLPQPGGDNGNWGGILNEYLSQALKTDGTIKDNAVTANTIAPNSITNAAIATNAINAVSIADGSITEVLLNTAVQVKLNASATPDANVSTKGKIQLAGDLGGSASAPTLAKIQGTAINASAPADGQVLNYSSSSSAWVPATVTSTTISDATTGAKGIIQLAGDLGGVASSPTVTRVNGITITGTPTNGQVLTASSTTAASWIEPVAGFADPTTTKGDLIVRGVSTTRQPVGSDGQVLVADSNQSTGVKWATTAGTPDATTTSKGSVQLAGDLGGTAASPTVPGLAAKESAVSPGTTSEYYRGDKTWQTLDKTAVNLANIDNTSDLNKPISTAQQTALDDKADLVGGHVPSAQLPSLALTDVVTVASQSAMLALTTSQVQSGDIAVRTDGAGTFILTAPDPSVLSNWTHLNSPTDLVTSVNGQQGVVVLGKSDVGLGDVDNTSDLNKPIAVATQTALDDKADLVGGKIPTSQVPSIALHTSVTVMSQAAMLALTAGQVQSGDLAIRTDGAGTFILGSNDPSQLSNWIRLNSPTDAVTSVNGQNGTVVLAKSDVGLGNVDNTADLDKPVSTAAQTALNTKTTAASLAVVATSGNYNDLTNKPTVGIMQEQALAYAIAL